MERTLELWLARHGETTFSAAKRVAGWSDPPLTDNGRQQAEALRSVIDGRRFAGGGLGDERIDIVAHGNIVSLDGPAELEALFEGDANRSGSQQANTQALAGHFDARAGMTCLGRGGRPAVSIVRRPA